MLHPGTIPTISKDSLTGFGDSPALSLQLGFIAKLPSDILLEIFSYLKRRDGLTCMAVCRDWYDHIPQYTGSCWKTVQISTRHIDTENQSLIRSLGDHVENITLESLKNEKDVYHIMDKLLIWGCTKIKSLELRECRTDDQDAFLDILTKLASHLTQLRMVEHGSNIAFLHVLKACPRLTRFTYLAIPGADLKLDWDPSVYDKEPAMLHAESPIGTFPDITHLHLDAGLSRQLRLDPILQRCPNLRSFVGASIEAGYHYNTLPRSIAIDFDLLFSWCPKISCITDALSYHSSEDLEDSNFQISDNDSGLRHLSVSNAYEHGSIIQLLTLTQHTLEHLSIRPFNIASNSIDWLSLLKEFQLSQLQTLVFYGIQISLDSVLAVCNQSPVLERLDLKRGGFTYDRSGNRSFRPMDQIRYLRLDDISFHNGLELRNILDQFPSLETISLYRLVLPLNFFQGRRHPIPLKKLLLSGLTCSINSGIDWCLLEWIADQTKLEEVVLLDISGFGTWCLSVFADISTLRNVDLSLCEDSCDLFEEDNLSSFASLLNGTAIEKICIRTSWHLPDTIVNEFKRLPRLTHFEVCHQRKGSSCKRCSK